MTERSSLNLQFLDCPLADNLLAFQIEYLPLIYSGFEPNDAVISACPIEPDMVQRISDVVAWLGLRLVHLGVVGSAFVIELAMH